MKYKISLSNKEEILTDEQGYKKLLDNISSNFVVLGDEVVNPSFIVSITKIDELAFADYSSFHNKETQRRIVGHIDENTRTYVIDGIEEL